MTLQPKIIVADASITKPKNMEVSCEKENPFHATVEKGFYKLQNYSSTGPAKTIFALAIQDLTPQV
jgi:hypothetical protein